MGFLPNGDLIVVSLDRELKDYKIYLYPFKNKPTTNSTLWEYSQIYDIEIPESFESLGVYELDCFIYQTKLFLWFYGRLIVQWNLLTMTLDMHYFLDHCSFDYKNIVINKNETLLALCTEYQTDVFSMETGTLISSYKG
jgi:hypothetical protein